MVCGALLNMWVPLQRIVYFSHYTERGLSSCGTIVFREMIACRDLPACGVTHSSLQHHLQPLELFFQPVKCSMWYCITPLYFHSPHLYYLFCISLRDCVDLKHILYMCINVAISTRLYTCTYKVKVNLSAQTSMLVIQLEPHSLY